MKEEYPFLKEYKNAWPVRLLIPQYINNHHANLRTKTAASEPAPANTGGAAGPSAEAPGPDGDDPNMDGSQNGNQSDVTVSNVDDG